MLCCSSHDSHLVFAKVTSDVRFVIRGRYFLLPLLGSKTERMSHFVINPFAFTAHGIGAHGADNVVRTPFGRLRRCRKKTGLFNGISATNNKRRAS
jgi:hypothetical protein